MTKYTYVEDTIYENKTLFWYINRESESWAIIEMLLYFW